MKPHPLTAVPTRLGDITGFSALMLGPADFVAPLNPNTASLFPRGTRIFCAARPQRARTQARTHILARKVCPARDSHIPDFTGRPEANPAAPRHYRQNYDKLYKNVQIVRMMSCALAAPAPEPAECSRGRSGQDLL